MSDKVAVVTGSRVKIGFQVCLKLLRAGCTVVATTRFPNNAVAAYRREKDFAVWKDKLHVYGLDLRDVTGLEAFTRYLKVTHGEHGIDILINNACQTIRRPGGYYMPLIEKETELWTNGDEAHKDVLRGCTEFERIRRRLVEDHHSGGSNGGNLLPASAGQDKLLLGPSSSPQQNESEEKAATANGGSNDIVAKNNVPFESTGISHSAAMSQIALVPEDAGVDEKIMPRGLSDINGQQLDLRTHNSWLLKMDQVSTPEIMECMFVNAIAPFVLNSRLKPLMEAPMGDPSRPDRYIINVSAMEGKFYRYKMPNHPHTNMAKAALNMLTRTSSEDLAKKSRVYMNSVDTGWINDENPLERASKTAKTNLFQTPIDEVDAAARILDPVFVGVNIDKVKQDKNEAKDYGKFFKDYKETEW
jgi:NAD(P)-dependent dehydrogenase (short-subunit alcohol dehydrogenase family)